MPFAATASGEDASTALDVQRQQARRYYLGVFAVLMATNVGVAFLIEKLALTSTDRFLRKKVAKGDASHPAARTSRRGKPPRDDDDDDDDDGAVYISILSVSAHLVNMLVLLAMTCHITYHYIDYPPAGLVVMVCGVVLMMKLGSYCMVQFALRQDYAEYIPDT